MVLPHFSDHTTPEWGKEKAENKVFASEPSDVWPYYANDHWTTLIGKSVPAGKCGLRENVWTAGKICLNRPPNTDTAGMANLIFLINLKGTP